MIYYTMTYTEQNYGSDVTEEQSHEIAEAIQWAANNEFIGYIDFTREYSSATSRIFGETDTEEQEASEKIKRWMDQNWSIIAGQVLGGSFYWD